MRERADILDDQCLTGVEMFQMTTAEIPSCPRWAAARARSRGRQQLHRAGVLISVDPGKVRPRRGVIGIQLDGTLQTLPGYTVVLRAHVAIIGQCYTHAFIGRETVRRSLGIRL
jgi:hypothetical protein